METVAFSAEWQRGGATNRRSWKTNQAHLIKLMLPGNSHGNISVVAYSLEPVGNLAEEKLRVQQMPQAEQNEANASRVRGPNVNTAI